MEGRGMAVRSFWVVLPLPLLSAACGLDAYGLLGVTGSSEGGVTAPSVDANATGDVGVGSGDDAGPTDDAPVVGQPDATLDAPAVPDAPAKEVGPPPPPDAPVGPTHPATCAEAGAGPGPQTVTLYVGGDPGKPWTAVCQGANAYLTVPSKTNFSSYPAGGCGAAQPAAVTTTWSMVRIDETTLVVDTSDFTGATSTGDTHEVSGNGTYVHDFTRMPYGAARSCVDQAPTKTSATIDLGGTPFVVATTQNWHIQGFSNNNQNNTPFGGESTKARAVSLSVGGFPGGISPCDDFYQTTGGACLQLTYAP
jgi:hypothetical protein